MSRVVGRTEHPDVDLTAYNLGVRGDSSTEVLARWRTECPPRWKDRSEKRLVVSVGMNDVVSGTTTARSRLNLANIIDDAAATGIATFVVGAPPTLDADFNRRLEVARGGPGRRLRAPQRALRRLLPPPGRPRPVALGR